MGKARRNSVQVNFDIIDRRIATIGLTRAGISRQLGYSSTWLIGAKKNDGRLRTKDAEDLCGLLGLKLEDVVVKEKEEPQEVPQSETEAPQTWGGAEMAKAIDKQTATLNARINSLSEDLKQLLEIAEKQRHYTYQIGVLLQNVIDKMGR